MIKAMGKGADGRDLFIIGLSFANLDKFYAAPRETYIRIDGKEHGLSADILIFSCETEAHGAEMMAEFIGPSSKVHVSDKLKE